MDVRIAIVTMTAGKMRNIWASRSTPIKLKIRIYTTGVCSRLTYGSEAWTLDARTCAKINDTNSRMMARLTGRTVHEEASSTTRTFDVLSRIRDRRLQWVGHILRMSPTRMVRKALQHTCANRAAGDLLMDVPTKYSWRELTQLAALETSGAAGSRK